MGLPGCVRPVRWALPARHVEFYPLGDRAVIVELGSPLAEATHRRIWAASLRLDQQPIPGIVEHVPSFHSLAVHYRPEEVVPVGGTAPGATPYQRVVAALRVLLTELDEVPFDEPRTIEIPVRYGGGLGPDLGEVAALHQLTPEEVIQIHTSGDYRVQMLGFVPGFPYLSGLPEKLATPRRSVPRSQVPAGSVGIGGAQTGVYPIASPGGWHLIGRTALKLFDIHRSEPALLRMGDRIRFRAVGDAEWERGVQEA